MSKSIFKQLRIGQAC